SRASRTAPPRRRCSRWWISASTGPTDRSAEPLGQYALEILLDGLPTLAEPRQLVEEDHQLHAERHRVREPRFAGGPAAHGPVVHLQFLRQRGLPAPGPVKPGTELAQLLGRHGLFVIHGFGHRNRSSFQRRLLKE